ncbi:MAG: hypothetical protein GX483_07680 [Actinomycetaceae bacterium]|nr:hypothetical protein [Actinomycetaceae bacterium]
MFDALVSAGIGAAKRFWWLTVITGILLASSIVLPSGSGESTGSESYTSTGYFAIIADVDDQVSTEAQRSSLYGWVGATAEYMIDSGLLNSELVAEFGEEALDLTIVSPTPIDSFYKTPNSISLVGVQVNGVNSELVAEVTDWVLERVRLDLESIYPNLQTEIYQSAADTDQIVHEATISGVSTKRVVVFFIVGVLAGFVLGMLIEFFTPRLRTRTDVEQILGVSAHEIILEPRNAKSYERQIDIISAALAMSVEEPGKLWLAGIVSDDPAQKVGEAIRTKAEKHDVSTVVIPAITSDADKAVEISANDHALIITKMGRASIKDLREARTLIHALATPNIQVLLSK